MIAELRRRFESLGARQREVMALTAAGNMNKQIGAKIGISEATVRLHRRKVMKKMGAKTLADLLRMAGHLGNLLLSGRCSDKIRASTVGTEKFRGGRQGDVLAHSNKSLAQNTKASI